ncbi:hypothetical protein NP493_43g00009 [Ridgeia piscesae]|uniref:Uncharacterized protein n=1 Tax=Ridgeia piscesae TaxID=27915 RepID=A0AAD9UJT1_RIDPI|nr:hypothetical protein NP493_43g00009 [Ridgeia piscesae]
MKTLFVAVACLCLLAVVAGQRSASLGFRPSLIRELSRDDKGEISAAFLEEPIQLGREESKKLKLPAEFNVCMVKAYRTVRRVRVGETLPRQKFNGVCIECSKCTKEGMKCSEVKPLAKFDNRRLVGEISFKRMVGHLRNELAVGPC